MQEFLSCPFKYFTARVLEIEELEDPARIWGFKRLAQGNLIHRVMEKLFKGAASIKDLQDPQKYQEKIRAILDKEGAEYLREEYPSPQALINIELDEIFFYLLKWREDLLPAKGFDQWEVEKSLGNTPVELDLMDGTSVKLSGRLDRIDRGGEKACVNDYKVSRSTHKGVQQIQLPIYLFSVCNLFGLPKENVDARFLIMVPEKLADVSFEKNHRQTHGPAPDRSAPGGKDRGGLYRARGFRPGRGQLRQLRVQTRMFRDHHSLQEPEAEPRGPGTGRAGQRHQIQGKRWLKIKTEII